MSVSNWGANGNIPRVEIKVPEDRRTTGHGLDCVIGIYNSGNKISYGFNNVRFVAIHTDSSNHMVEVCQYDNPEDCMMVYKSLYDKHAKVVDDE